jgi:hypothetical protein
MKRKTEVRYSHDSIPAKHSTTFIILGCAPPGSTKKGMEIETYRYHHTLKISSIRKQGRRIHRSNEKALCKAHNCKPDLSWNQLANQSKTSRKLQICRARKIRQRRQLTRLEASKKHTHTHTHEERETESSHMKFLFVT